MSEIPGWFDFEDVYDLAANLEMVVEVGALLGKSTAYLAKKVKRVYVVDTWCGSGGSDPDSDAINLSFTGKTEYFDDFVANMRQEGVLHKIAPLRMKSHEASRLFLDESVDFVFFDAAHDYQTVRLDLLAWHPKVKVGGMLAGHDYNDFWPDVVRAVDDFFVEPVTRIGNSWIVWKAG